MTFLSAVLSADYIKYRQRLQPLTGGPDVEAGGSGKAALDAIEGEEDFGVEFERDGDVQNVHASRAELSRVAARE